MTRSSISTSTSTRRSISTAAARALGRHGIQSLWRVALGASLIAAGCTGGDDPSDKPSTEEPERACGPKLERRVVVLTDQQFSNSVRDLLGEQAIEPGQIPDIRLKPFTKKGLVIGTSLVHTRLGNAAYAAKSLEGRFEAVTGCAPTGDDACAHDFLTRFANRAFRRPLEAPELANLWAVYDIGKETSYERGVQVAVEAILASPSFTYRTELGEQTDGKVAKLTPHEVASELAIFLTDSLPDAELAAAADSGALRDPEEVVRQTERMLAKPETRSSLTSTLIAAWGLSNLFGNIKDPGLFPEYNPLLQASMFHETELFMEEMLWKRGADVSTLLSSRDTFVNEPLAKLYRVQQPAGANPEDFSPVTLPAWERAGLLTQPGFLAALSRTDNTSVVARGLFVRSALLCLPKLPSPPESLAGEITKLLNADMTERERANVRAGNATCGACHARFDAFGLMLEKYDPLGRYRETLEGEPIDSHVELTDVGSFEGSYSSAVEFADSAAKNQDFAACITRHLLTYSVDDERISPTDCQVKGVLKALPEGDRSVTNIVKAIVTSPALTERAVEE